MKLAENIIKLALAIAAVAGVIFLVLKYMDAIKAWMERLCPACELEEEIIEEAVADESVDETVDESAEEAAEDPVEEAPAVEEIVIEDGTPLAEETDFAE